MTGTLERFSLGTYAPRLAGVVLTPLLFLGGCAHSPSSRDMLALPTPQPPAPFAPVQDERAAFRAAFCERRLQSPGNPTDCDALLWKLPDEASITHAGIAAPPPMRSGAYHVVVVTGAFGDCRWRDMVPFGPALERLQARGVDVHPVVVGGRSSAEHNAQQIAATLSGIDVDAKLILVGYSKGTVDILQFLVSYPDAARHVAAVVGFAGPVFGSPLAIEAGKLYSKLPKDAFGSFCEPGDGGLFDSLLPDTRRTWLLEHPLPGHVRYYSVAAFTTHEHLSRGLRHSWRELAVADPRNDGQVVLGDALIPGSTLLAFANADHWDLAIDLEAQVPLLSSRPDARLFPRDLLFETVLDYVAYGLDGNTDGVTAPAGRHSSR